jgi:hypothetical protein
MRRSLLEALYILIFIENRLFLLIIQRVQDDDINRTIQWIVKLQRGAFDESQHRFLKRIIPI